MSPKNIISAGKNIQEAGKVLVMVHGRGGNAGDILSLAGFLQVDDFALLAPQAKGNTWYPYSFMMPPEQNEPGLSSSLEILKELTEYLAENDIPRKNLYFLGFSQGACLTLEFAARNASRFGGIVAFSGGLIGDRIYPENYMGDFESTPVFIGSSNPDPHIPIERVYATTNILKKMNAAVTEKIYPDMGHTINKDEIELVNKLVFSP